MVSNSNCILCDAVYDSQNNGVNSKIENRLLYSTKSFIVTPCISPIVPGHVLITSKSHYQNLSCMSYESIVEINEIIDNVIIKMQDNYNNYLIAEHGAYDFEQNSGACIIHTHLHIIPNCENSIILFDKVLEYNDIEKISEVKDVAFPYILALTNKLKRIYLADNVPSQMIRRLVLAEKNEINNWNWRLKINEDFNRLTIKMWNEIL